MSVAWFISTAVAPIYRKPDFRSEIVTQGLIWEKVTILEQRNGWVFIKMEDEYRGWIHQFYISEINIVIEDYVFITDRFVNVLLDWNNKDSIKSILSFGSRIPLLDKTSKYFKIMLNCNTIGYINKQSNMKVKYKDDFIKIGSKLLGAPYLWGGKSSFGYDCSGLIQMIFKAVGIYFPRDTSQQFIYNKLKSINKKEAQSGDLIFFSKNNKINHIGLVVDKDNILHCSGQVKYDSINKKKINFNKNLSKMDHTYFSTSDLFI
tara:strand:+ start:540 stop:1325 length:786 start_codon:yes stop_codon:yes gene_type:complete